MLVEQRPTSHLLLEVEEVSVGYGRIEVVRGLSLEVKAGEAVGLFGPNGHGKTTLLRGISGLQAVSSGEVRFAGHSIKGFRAEQIAELGLIHVSQGNSLFRELTVGEALSLGAFAKRARAREVEALQEVTALFPRLKDLRARQCGSLSGGERQMVALAIGMMARPRLLMLDEPTLGLAPKIRSELQHQIMAIRAQGVSLLLVDGDIDFVATLTDRWCFVEGGRITSEASSSDEGALRRAVEMYFSDIVAADA